MGANDKNLEIIKKVFGGDAGKQGAFFREMFEVLLLEREATEENPINEIQKAEIDKRIAQGKNINKVICEALGVQALEDMKPEEIISEEITEE